MKQKPGRVAPNRFGVYDPKGRLRGQVTAKATSATVARFHGVHGSVLGPSPDDGKLAWLAPLAEVSAAGAARSLSSKGATQTKIGGNNG